LRQSVQVAKFIDDLLTLLGCEFDRRSDYAHNAESEIPVSALGLATGFGIAPGAEGSRGFGLIPIKAFAADLGNPDNSQYIAKRTPSCATTGGIFPRSSDPGGNRLCHALADAYADGAAAGGHEVIRVELVSAPGS
jgi:hypothetical protein